MNKIQTSLFKEPKQEKKAEENKKEKPEENKK